MSGFVEWEIKQPNYCDVMTAFQPGEQPVLEFLASEFAVFDRYFSSHPGPTWPNRMMALSGTTGGDTDTWPMFNSSATNLYSQPTIFDQLLTQGFEARMYVETTPWELFMTSVLHNPAMVRGFDSFLQDCRDGTLPHWSWVSPRAGGDHAHNISCDSQHPTCPIPAGDAFLKRIYDAVRASPSWNNTLLLVTWDGELGFD